MIQGLQPYASMKDSGLRWLGDIPEHWDVRRAKYFYRESDERSSTGEEELLSVSHITGVTPRSQKNISMFLAESTVGYKACRPGDVVVNTMWAWMAALGIARQSGLVSPSYAVYRPSGGSQLVDQYVDRLLRTPAYANEYFVASTGINSSRLRLYPEQFLRIRIVCPPPLEQRLIVRFLDHADRRIRRYIRAKQRLIGLLEEQKNAIIHRAVTRGLDPDVRLKSSGVQWLDDVPEHWEVLPLRRRWSVTDCKHLTVPFVEDGVPLASVREVQSFDLRLERAKRTTLDWYQVLIEGDRQPRRGDLIYCRNVSVGASAVVETDEPLAMGQDVCLIRSKEQNQRFLNYFLHSPAMASQLALLMVGSTFDRINVADVKNLLIVVPPRSEQGRIAAFLDESLLETERAIDRSRSEQRLLREYCVRLVADVVTGKLDVREAAAQLPEDVQEPNEGDEVDTEADVEEPSDDGDAVAAEAEA